jgi:cell division protease FtsH
MSETLGPRTFGQKEELIFLGREISEQRDYSEKTALMIDSEVNKLITKAYDTAIRVLTDNKDRLIHLAQILIVKENLEGEALEAAFSEPVTTPIPTGITAAIPPAAPAPVSKPGLVPPTASPAPNPAPNPMPSN